MRFRFAGLLHKYNKPYTFIRENEGKYDGYGDWVPSKPSRVTLRGHFQPVDAKLQQAEGGQYTDDDRTLYTLNEHQTGDLLEYNGVQYTVHTQKPRDYADFNQFIVKKVVANDPV